MSVRIVDSGTFYIGKRQILTLEAILGTCVGLALIDRKNDIAGLYHILLPEPPDPGTDFQREAYASTGLPVFLSEMVRRGADPARLEAHIAGGALVGPVSEEDFIMNIGGETFDVVESFLRENNIPIVYLETGGFFACRIQLDMRNFSVRVDPFESPEGFNIERFPRPTREDLIGTVSQLKPIPQVALKILDMVKRGDYSFAEISEEVRKDQVIAAKILAFCQSPMFRLPHGIQSIDRALVVLGERRLLQAVLMAYCEDVFRCATGGYSMCRGGLFNHAVTTAHIAQALARSFNLPEDQAYTAGLLHDIGKIVLDHYIHPVAPYFYRKVLNEGRSLVEIEKSVFGVTHIDTGEILCREWELPDAVYRAVRGHELSEFDEAGNMLIRIIKMANFLSGTFLPGQSLSAVGAADAAGIVRGVPLGKGQLLEVLGAASEVSRAVKS
ncbi:HDOD domain-containing protein [Thermodesulforhabdus norvegica]|uniref:HDIG domain-containing protein n=1 Tax=Thermodesulforhabdus norvegica TaxID=39841 RepID=A0A1I4VKT6_9BACT|nr:HDOD domain-containing protein [Thermodesulforhabdus norvegica]SFN01811.1 HDIG domain-containing protein [Thermodesulforhabdus norvegica]